MDKKTVHRLVGVCGILLIAIVLYGLFSLVWWFLAPIVWKFSASPFEGTEENGIHVE